MTTRWSGTDAPRGDDYDARWQELAATGALIHGEADLVDALLSEHGRGLRVLDAGCGTGRVAIELAARGFETVGVDVDESMLATARAKAPALDWRLADLGGLRLDCTFDAIVAAGNVMIFLDPGSEAKVVARLAAHLASGGLLIAGFQLRSDRLSIDQYDNHATAAGLRFVGRYATWDRAPFDPNGDYAVSVHCRE